MKVYVIEDMFSGYYAGYHPTEWKKQPSDALQFETRAKARKHADRIKDGPRQFAGLGQHTRVIEVEKQ